MNILGSFFLNEERKVFKGRAEVETDAKMKTFGNLVLAILYWFPSWHQWMMIFCFRINTLVSTYHLGDKGMIQQ